MYKKTCLLSALLAIFAFGYTYGSTVAERGGGGGFHGSEGQVRQSQGEGDHRNGGYYGGYGGYEGGVPVVAPVYPGGGYLLPGPVDPGQDEADAIYRANQHPGE